MYTVMFYTEGYFCKKVKGDNEKERLHEFEAKLYEADFGELENIDWEDGSASPDYDEEFVDSIEAKQKNMFHKNLYTILVTGRYKVILNNYYGTDINTIKTLATDIWSDADFGELDDCEERILWIEDKDGRRIYQNL